MEPEQQENPSPNAAEIIQSLSRSAHFAKEMVYKIKSGSTSVSGPELFDTVKQLDKVIKEIGEALKGMPESPFENNDCLQVTDEAFSKRKRVHLQPTPSLLQSGQESLPSKNVEENVEGDFHGETTSENLGAANSKGHNYNTSRLIEYARNMSFGDQEKNRNSRIPSQSLPRIAEYMDPLYETFFCPLTKKIMEDPVTIESGQTYERRAIEEWFSKCDEKGEGVTCPSIGTKITNTSLSTNLALKTTIEQWQERNEATRIKLAHAALSLGSSEGMIIEALKEIQGILQKRKHKKEIHKLKMIPLLAQLVEHKDVTVKCEALGTLRLLAKEDEEKELIAQTNAIPLAVRLMSSPGEQLAAVSLLLELSTNSLSLCEKIGSRPGAILLLITIKYNTTDSMVAEKANMTLNNLVKCPKNIKIMAENGLLEPLLSNLIEGPEDIQVDMASYLGKVVLSNESKLHVTKRAATSLMRMACSDNLLGRRHALIALGQISSYHPSSKPLIEAGIAPMLIEQLFNTEACKDGMELKEFSSAVLVNILESRPNFETLQLNAQGRNMVSDYVIFNIIHMIKSSSPKLIKNLVRILLCLSESPKAMTSILAAAKGPDTMHMLIELINYSEEDLTIATAKLLILLSAHVGHTLADKLCKTYGQPGNLIKTIDTNEITELASVTANFLAKLPSNNLAFNISLAQRDTLPIALHMLHKIQVGAIRTSRFMGSYLEGLVGILVRFTFTLYDSEILSLAKSHNLSLVLTELLMRPGNDEVQRLAAVGLENLSTETITLSQIPPTLIKKKSNKGILTMFNKPKTTKPETKLCPIHKGVCSSTTTFCLMDSRALETLLACLDHQNVDVVKASLSAISTLLDHRVDVHMGVFVLSKIGAAQQILNVLKEHKDMSVWQKSFWLIEKFMTNGQSLHCILNDKVLPVALVTAFHHGDITTRHLAERVLRLLNKIPNDQAV
ncbi:putative U-box domain-containing protein 42 [Nymphaea thermarum]|nr:putative U-box domain-containing protein 42 [Nymphaea thermarum]